MKRQTRFTTESQILDRIDAALNEAKTCLEWAVQCDAAADECRRRIVTLTKKMESLKGKKRDECQSEINQLSMDIKSNRDEAVRLSKRRNSIENATLPRLKQALAAFKTELLPITNDPTVVLL